MANRTGNSKTKISLKINVFFSAPLDIDFMMLEQMGDMYKATLDTREGPCIDIAQSGKKERITKIENDGEIHSEYETRILKDIKNTLKEEGGDGHTYSPEQQKLMVWYTYVVSLFTMTTAFAQEYPTQNNNARYIGISMLNADLSIDDNGKSSCSGNVTLNNSSYSTDLTMELIQVDTGKVMKTWTDSGSISISLTNKPWYVTSGHRYQVKVTVTVYNTSGKSIETSEEVSSIVKF